VNHPLTSKDFVLKVLLPQLQYVDIAVKQRRLQGLVELARLLRFSSIQLNDPKMHFCGILLSDVSSKLVLMLESYVISEEQWGKIVDPIINANRDLLEGLGSEDEVLLRASIALAVAVARPLSEVGFLGLEKPSSAPEPKG